jgi:hypothetical protein
MKLKVHQMVLMTMLVTGAAAPALAQTAAPSTGLGQSWPNAADVSASPQWHVYVFTLNGVEYVQINDLNGTVHAAVGTANGTTIVLPVGVDAQNVSASAATSSSSTTSSTTTTTVYSDSAITVTATPQTNGTTQFTTANTSADCGSVFNCGGGRGS